MPSTAPDPSTSVTDPAAVRRRWWALITLCMGELMIVLDTSIANVALPSIQAELNFSASNLVWVVNAYMLTYGGFLLLGGRLGDLYGARRAFLWGLAVFALASAACGLAQTQAMLIVALAVQGLGGAVVSAVALALIVNTFPEGPQRARAMGVYGFICASGGSIGVLLGGVITSQFNWHWVFLVNLPLGVAVMLVTRVTVDADAPPTAPPRLDIAGAVTVTGSLLCAVYAFVEAAQAGWASLQTLGLLAVAAVELAIRYVVLRLNFAQAEPVRVARAAEQLANDHPAKKPSLEFIKKYEAIPGAGARSTFAAYLWDASLLLQDAVPRAMKGGAKPGTPEFRKALRDAIEASRDVRATNGVYNMSATDHIGLDQRSRVMTQIQKGTWKYIGE